MEVSDPQTVTVLVWIMAGLVLINGLSIVMTTALCARAVRQCQIGLERTILKARFFCQEGTRQLERLAGTRERFQHVLQSVRQSLDGAYAAVIVLDGGVERLLRSTRNATLELGREVEYVLLRIEHQTAHFSRIGRHLATQLRALRRGAAAAVEAFGVPTRRRVVTDEDWFI